MDWSNSINKEKGIIFIKIQGKKNIPDSIRLVTESAEIARNNNIKKFIFDFTKTEDKYSVIDIYDNLNNVKNYGFKKNDRVAIVGKDTVAEHEFTENVSYNLGWINLKYFNSFDDAIKWVDG